MSYATRYAAMMRQRSDAYSSSPEAAAARLKVQEALKRAAQDRDSNFPGDARLTEEACDYFNERVDYWRKEMGA